MSERQTQKKDFLGEEYKTLKEMSQTKKERAELITDLAFRVLVENSSDPKKFTSYQAQEFLYTPGQDGELYRLPNHNEETITRLDRNYTQGKNIGFGVREVPNFRIGGYLTAEGVPFVKVEQQCLIEHPLKKEGVFLATMTECTCLIARNDSSLFVAHIGYGEKGNVAQVMEFFREKGVDPTKVVAVVMDRETQPKNEWHQTITSEDLIKYGIIQENVFERHADFVPPEKTEDGSYGYNGATQVTVTPDFVSVRSFKHRKWQLEKAIPARFEPQNDLAIKEL